jgi:TnpA family transposase
MFREIGDVQLPDILLQVDAATNFSESLLGRRPRDVDEVIGCYAAMLAIGTETDVKSIVAMMPQLDAGRLPAAMRAIQSPGRVRRANDRVQSYQRQHSITELWGSGELGSSDSMSVDATRHLWNARIDPRRRTYAIGMYTHILDTHGLAYGQPVVLNERQVGPAIEGVVRYNEATTSNRLLRLAVDTHGYTHPGTAMARGVGFDLCPRLRNVSERKLLIPRGMEISDALVPVTKREVSIKAIRTGWDEYLRAVASILTGRVSAAVLMQRLGSAAQGDHLHSAATSLGKLLRTIYLCDYFSNDEFRREIHTILNRGESAHLLQRAIYTGKIAPDRGRRRDELAAISGVHTLLTNIVIAWNTHRMQEVVDRARRQKHPIDERWLARVSPTHFGHINFRGQMSFGIGAYAALVLDSAAIRDARLGRVG